MNGVRGNKLKRVFYLKKQSVDKNEIAPFEMARKDKPTIR
jgi:hypothetical protein